MQGRDYGSLKIRDLKREIERRNRERGIKPGYVGYLKVTGRKGELIERLRNDDLGLTFQAPQTYPVQPFIPPVESRIVTGTIVSVWGGSRAVPRAETRTGTEEEVLEFIIRDLDNLFGGDYEQWIEQQMEIYDQMMSRGQMTEKEYENKEKEITARGDTEWVFRTFGYRNVVDERGNRTLRTLDGFKRALLSGEKVYYWQGEGHPLEYRFDYTMYQLEV